MKFTEMVEELQKLEENKGKVVLARCGAFMNAIGKDAIFLHKVLKLNVNCIKPNICKAGIPVTHTLKYVDLMEKMGYSCVVYDYDHGSFDNIYIFDILEQRERERLERKGKKKNE